MDAATQANDPAPNPGSRPAGAPQLRTLLLTDLVDSTGIVERLGDTPASELFRAHDRLVLQLQQQWRGRLIDRSDGLLLLFERPIDGLGFALDYARGLTGLGAAHGVELRARAGLHVGEVLTWRNSDEAVSVGAKPLEVEGLAKPMAGRLMTIARPGQILLSAVAEPLARRAARELGERGQHLLWKSWGRWRFKGVPEVQQIFEVGEPGVAPLRMPLSTPKAWRDIPLWRRPAMLAAEAALLIGGAIGLWFITKPVPAIAFNQRDWVVVGDLRNLTGQVALDDSLEQAFRVSLEQSRHVNVLSDLKARDTLARMRRAPDTVLDRAIASEIALRDGARAVILPTVAEVGGRVRVSAEVVDPHTQTTVYSESADGEGLASTLRSIDKVTASLRGRLGEAVASIERSATPLPQVTTSNLVALRAYALGEKAYFRGQYGEALHLYERATALDPQFALAWIGQVRSHYAQVDAPAALLPLKRAQTLRDRLAPREALYLDAWSADLQAPADAGKKWSELAQLYPDYWPAQTNAAWVRYYANDFEHTLALARAATVPQNAHTSTEFDLVGRALLGTERIAQAAKPLERAVAAGYPAALRRRAMVDAADRKFPQAAKWIARMSESDRHTYLERTSIALDEGRWSQAGAMASTGLALAEKEDGLDSRYFLIPISTVELMIGDRTQSLRNAERAADRALVALAAGFDADAQDDAATALAAALVAQRLDDEQLAEKVLLHLKRYEALMTTPWLAELATVLHANQLRRAGRTDAAIALLTPLVTGRERYQTHVALMEAYAHAGRAADALAEARWLQQHRGRAYVELTCGHCLQALNVADSNLAVLREAELLARAGRHASANEALKRFDRLWPLQTLPDHLRSRRTAVESASSRGGV